MSAIRVTAVVAWPQHATEVALALPPGATVADALAESRLGRRHPEIDLARSPVGIFGRRVARERVLADGDRVEVYRPLVADPKEARRRRAGR